MNVIIERIEELRRIKGLSKKAMADRSGISRSTVSNWYYVDAIPSLSVIDSICNVLGVTTEQFFSGMGNLEGDKAEREFIDDWRMLSDTEKLAVEKVMCAFKELKAVHND